MNQGTRMSCNSYTNYSYNSYYNFYMKVHTETAEFSLKCKIISYINCNNDHCLSHCHKHESLSAYWRLEALICMHHYFLTFLRSPHLLTSSQIIEYIKTIRYKCTYIKTYMIIFLRHWLDKFRDYKRFSFLLYYIYLIISWSWCCL